MDASVLCTVQSILGRIVAPSVFVRKSQIATNTDSELWPLYSPRFKDCLLHFYSVCFWRSIDECPTFDNSPTLFSARLLFLVTVVIVISNCSPPFVVIQNGAFIIEPPLPLWAV